MHNQLIKDLDSFKAITQLSLQIGSLNDSDIHLANNFPETPQLIYERNNEAGRFTEFLKHRVVCIAGMPGVGKSTLAIKFGYHRSESSSATVRFFSARTVLELTEDYKSFAEILKVNDEDENKRIGGVNSKLIKLAETKQIQK